MQEQYTRRKDLTIPYCLLKELSHSEAILYSVMYSLYSELPRYSAFSPTNKVLMHLSGIPERTLIRSLTKLEELGYVVTVSKKRGCPTIWHVNELQKDSHLPLQSEPRINEAIKELQDLLY